MYAEVTPGWNVFKQIFTEHWEGFKPFRPRYNTPYYDDLVDKMLRCGNPDQIGYIEYRCLHCGQGKHRVAMSCKSSLCLRCAKVYVDHWVAQVGKMLHDGVIYRHIVLTVPDVLRTPFYQHAEALLSPFMQCGVQCLDDFFSTVSGKALKGGYIVVVQTHGRNGQYNPHLHIIATSGGWDAQAHTVGAFRLFALSDAAQEVAVVCPGDVSRGLEDRRDGSSGEDLLRQVSQRVCGQCAEG